jgi:2-amino-4-hydroxy-6-hydroxymethyldihydropteridine diphosphokinase
LIFIAFGANLPGPFGAPEQALRVAEGRLKAFGVHIEETSRIWRSAPVPVSDQPWYCNTVTSVRTSLSPQGLLAVLQALELDFGRIRTIRNAARVLDVDIVAYNECLCDEEGLTLPHPRMCERAFVLYPLRDVAPGWIHPVSGKSLEILIRDLPPGQKIEPIDSEERGA